MMYFIDDARFFLRCVIGISLSIFFLFLSEWLFLPHVSFLAWGIFFAVVSCGSCVVWLNDEKSAQLFHEKIWNRYDVYGVGLIISIAFLIRWLASDTFFIGVDASYHLEAARDFLSGQWPSYDRALLYSAIIAIFQWLFGFRSLVASIVPGFIFNLMTLVVLWYGVARFLNKRVAYISLFLLAILPWSVAQASTIRMYTLFQLIFLIFIFWVYGYFVEHGERRIDITDSIISFAGLGIVFMIAIHMHLLILGVIPLLYLFFTLFILMKIASRRFFLKDIICHRMTFFVLGSGLMLGGFYIAFPQFFLSSFTNFETIARPLPHHGLNYIDWFLGQFGNPYITLMLLAVALGCTAYASNRRQCIFLIFIQSIFYGYLFQLSQLYTTFFATRYAFHIAPLFIVLVAVGIDALVRIFIRERYALVSIGCVAFLFIVLVVTNVRHELLLVSRKESSQEILYPYEIRYPFKEVIGKIPIRQDDYLLSLHPGMWRFFQNVSDHVFDINVYNKLYRSLENESVVISRFLNLIKKSHRGYYLTDTFRQEKWKCGKTLVPCFLRAFVKTYFVHRSEWDAGELLVYEWTTLHADAVVDRPDAFRGRWLGEYMEYAVNNNSLLIRPLPALLQLTHSQGLLLIVSIDGSNVFVLIPDGATADNVYRYDFSGKTIDLVGIVDEDAARVIDVSNVH